MTLARIFSSHGHATFDTEDGAIVEDFLDEDGWPFENHPLIINIEELQATYPSFPLARNWDVLDLGYITVGGIYEPPCDDWRSDMGPTEPL